jgi:lysophospholipase L1-like esterase
LEDIQIFPQKFQDGMKNLLCYGDSNTWGADPRDISRFPWPVRWPGQLQALLGEGWHVAEAGLSNRTTGFDDPLIADRSGWATLSLALDTHGPLDTVIVMLGTNDAKTRFRHQPEHAADAIERIARRVFEFGATPILVAPPPMTGPIRFAEFDPARAAPFSLALAALYAEVATSLNCLFLDAGQRISVSPLDGVHLDEAAHRVLAGEVARLLKAN